eukprot:9471320-Pyramimonas_sp.AAC.1
MSGEESEAESEEPSVASPPAATAPAPKSKARGITSLLGSPTRSPPTSVANTPVVSKHLRPGTVTVQASGPPRPPL